MDHLYIVTYDISHPKRWRKVFKTMHGYGEWLQLSVFQCRLGKMRALQLEAELKGLVHHKEDHVLIVDLGPAENIRPRVHSIGKAFNPVEHGPVIV